MLPFCNDLLLGVSLFSPLCCSPEAAPLFIAFWKVEGEWKTEAREALDVYTAGP